MTITSLPSGSFFLENIPDIDILTAKTRLLVTINIGDDIIYDEYLYPADGEIRVSDLADIFRPYARRRLAVTATITIAEQQVPDSGDTDSATVTDTQTANLQVYYSTVDIVGVDCSTFLTTHFLTLLEGHKTTYMGRNISTTWARTRQQSPHTFPTKPQNCLPHQPPAAMTSTPPSTFLRQDSRQRVPTFSTTW